MDDASRVLMLFEKHETRVIPIPDSGSIQKMGPVYEAALAVVRERYLDGVWYENWDDGDPAHQWGDRAYVIAQSGDGPRAWDLLNERKDHEYEGFELKQAQPATGSSKVIHMDQLAAYDKLDEAMAQADGEELPSMRALFEAMHGAGLVFSQGDQADTIARMDREDER